MVNDDSDGNAQPHEAVINTTMEIDSDHEPRFL